MATHNENIESLRVLGIVVAPESHSGLTNWHEIVAAMAEATAAEAKADTPVEPPKPLRIAATAKQRQGNRYQIARRFLLYRDCMPKRKKAANKGAAKVAYQKLVIDMADRLRERLQLHAAQKIQARHVVDDKKRAEREAKREKLLTKMAVELVDAWGLFA